MKSNVFTLALVAFFLFATNTWVVKADSDTNLYHNVEQKDNIVSTTYFKGDGTNLAPFKKKVNTLNEVGQCISKVTYVWDSVSNEWAPLDKMEYTYNGENVSSVDRFAWNKKRNDWSQPQTISYTYDENGVSPK